jgi:type IV secretion system protein VirB9
MRGLLVMLGICLIIGCAKEQPVPPPPEDLSTWAVPELVQPPPVPPPVVVVVEPPVKPTAAEKVYQYTPGATFAMQVSANTPLDLVLEKGEQVRNIVGGDRAPADAQQTARWEVKEGADGLGETFRQHVFITVGEEKLATGLIITTTKRTYYLTCTSVKTSPVRVVRWQYPHDEPAEMQPRPHEPGLLPDPQEPHHYHVGYELVSAKPPPSWQPRQVVDDGTKTYILYPEVTLFETVPMLRLIGPNGPQLVNARQFLNVVIVDQLVARGELRVGIGAHAETVTITRGQLKTIACPGDPSCPVWPQAAQALARKGRGPTAPSVHAVTEGGQP